MVQEKNLTEEGLGVAGIAYELLRGQLFYHPDDPILRLKMRWVKSALLKAGILSEEESKE